MPLIIAGALDAELRHQDTPQLGLVWTDEPSAGKSEVLSTIEWHALQYGTSQLLDVVLYNWRGAFHITRSQQPPLSTSRAFGVDPFNVNKVRFTPASRQLVMRTLGPPAGFVFVDEYSFLLFHAVVQYVALVV